MRTVQALHIRTAEFAEHPIELPEAGFAQVRNAEIGFSGIDLEEDRFLQVRV